MATFSRTTFDAASYLAFRPSYPRWVHDKVLAYHFGRSPSSSASSQLAVDLGCGPGISTLSLLPHFSRVIGVDPSSKMVDAAVTPDTPNLPSNLIPDPADGPTGQLGQIEYRQGYSESLDFLQDGSVDLITAGQAAHWFDYPSFWREATRVVRPGGSVCLYGYPDFFLPEFPSTRSLLNKFALKDGAAPGSPKLNAVDEQPEKVDSIGAYWEQPGRSIVNAGLSPVPFPFTYPEMASHWDEGSAFKRTFSTTGLPKEHHWSSWPPPTTHPLTASLPDEVASEFTGKQESATMDKHLDWSQLASYLRTWSATHTYLSEHPNEKADVVDRFVQQLKQAVTRENGGNEVEQLHLRWPLCFVMVQKKSV
ncbi:Methyltransferase type 11 [Kalmanozyma brasiliensis GHG001]|uniref:Methyltransferase type 11 domain-containing protein n=1 Tax=Kalmanozyma brasiliensis (strain GHG001) TaxID=1365824 RepID=V5ESG2_KALBG|nr:Methyltransferase type 11 [Kalmanozyma brasiliensis GHG001]EST04849.1 Methyltransferase type 11 [Kalmanozyma brasiliensis GHG001]